MAVKNLGLSAAIAVWTYLLLTLVFGERGMIAYARLSDYRDELSYHIGQLNERQRDLAAAAERLQSDPEEIRIEARRMGYVGRSEGLIRIPGHSVPRADSETPGEKLPPPARWSADRSLLRALALSAALLAFFALQTMRRDSK
ncbi:MAG: septum formation initiator family protein [Spirochaetaceae bacterium]|nr:MAG: septum formation initiator family protein [Spirochaetaceae bacterium]